VSWEFAGKMVEVGEVLEELLARDPYFAGAFFWKEAERQSQVQPHHSCMIHSLEFGILKGLVISSLN